MWSDVLDRSVHARENSTITLDYRHDDTGNLIGLHYAGKEYFYLHDLLGLIVAIIDDEGTRQVSYRYTAYGTPTITVNRSLSGSALAIATILSTENLYLYKDYLYDHESRCYYCTSRWYDPEWGQWLSPDDVAYLDPEALSGVNLYCYCANNPVMNADESGTSWEWLNGTGRIITGIGAVVAGVLVIASGVALVPMLIVAGVTIAAGALTTVNGVADIQQSITGNNFIRDGIFCGNQTAYNWYAGIAEGVAVAGSVICGGWLKSNQPRIKAYKKMGNYNVKIKHLIGAKGDWSKFASVNQSELRVLGREAIKRTSMKQLLYNSPDSYRLIYDFGRTIGYGGESSVRLVFSFLGKNITFFPV